MRKPALIISLFIVSFILISISLSFGQEQTMKIGDVTLSIGMDRSKALKKLRHNYKLEQDKTTPNCPDTWRIATKSKQMDADDHIGNVCFIDEKLAMIVRNWGKFPGSGAHDIAKTLFGLVSNLEKEGKNNVELSTKSQYSPNVTMNAINVVVDSTAGERVIFIAIFGDSRNPALVTILEAYTKEGFPAGF